LIGVLTHFGKEVAKVSLKVMKNVKNAQIIGI